MTDSVMSSFDHFSQSLCCGKRHKISKFKCDCTHQFVSGPRKSMYGEELGVIRETGKSFLSDWEACMAFYYVKSFHSDAG